MSKSSNETTKNEEFDGHIQTRPREIDYNHMEKKWENRFTKEKASILGGKMTKNVLNIIGILAIEGPSSIQKIVSNLPTSKEVNYDRYGDIRRLIKGREKTSSHTGNKSLIAEGYLKPVGYIPEQKGYSQRFFLTLKGCLFSLGYYFNDDELYKFIKNASKNHIFFAYLDSILDKTSMEFVKEIFIDPIYELIEDNVIQINSKYSLDFFIDNISRIIGTRVDSRYKTIIDNEYFHERDEIQVMEDRLNGVVYDNVLNPREIEKEKKFLQILIENTFYGNYNGWDLRMKNYYYPTKKERDFYDYFSDESFIPSTRWIEEGSSYRFERWNEDGIKVVIDLFGHNKDDVKRKAWFVGDETEIALLHKVMKSIHFAFYGAEGWHIPKKHRQTMPRSKRSTKKIRLDTDLSGI